MRLVALAVLAVLPLGLAMPGHAAKPKPPLCAAGSFAVAEASSPLVPGGSAIPDQLTLADDGRFSIASGCPAVGAKQKGSKKGNKLSAKWTKKTGLCTGLPKTASLKATFDASCATLTGTFKSKGVKRPFTATRSFESFGAPSLAPALDRARHTAKTLGPAGGDVFARGTGGARFRLAVPPGALAQEVAITLTPVTALGGLPLQGGLVSALDLQPAGLAFAIPATLYVMPAGGVPEGPVAGFGWSGAANAFAVSPWWTDPEGRWAAISVEHFSGYGIGIPGPSQLDALLGELAALGSAQGELEGVLTACLYDPGEPCTEGDREALLAEWYDAIVAPRIEAADGAPVATVIAAHEALRYWVGAVAAAFEDLELPVPDALATHRSQGLLKNLANLSLAFQSYKYPTCSGAVTDWKDWLRIPEELYVRAHQVYEAGGATLLGFSLSPADYCARLFLSDVSFPPDLTPETTELPLSFKTYLAVFAQELQPIAAHVDLSYSEGASGPAEVVTSADGTLDETIVVQRTPGSALSVRVDLYGVELELERPDVLSDGVVAVAGALAFDENADPAPSPILDLGSAAEQCVQVGLAVWLAAPPGQLVQFTLEGPGSLSAGSAAIALDPSDGVPRACVDYIAPAGPVATGETAALHATLDVGGQSYQDELALHPRWIEIALEADVGSGLEPASNAILWVADTGPFAIGATVTGPGATAEDPAAPAAGAHLDAQGQAALLSQSGTGGAPGLALTTNAAGQAGFALTADDAGGETTHAVELRHDPQGSSDVAGVVLKRLPPVMALSLPATVAPGVPVPFELTATEGTDPAEGYHVELGATGGSVGAETGTTNQDGEFATPATLDPGQTQLSITATLRAEPDGEALDVQTVQASAGDAASVFLVSRRHVCAGVAGGVRVGVYAGMHGCPAADWTLDSDVETTDGTIDGKILSLSANGTGVPAHGPFGSWGRVDASVEFRVEAEPVLATFELSASGPDAQSALAPTGSGAELVGCADAGMERCPPGATAAGAVVLQPGSYLIGGGTFVLAGSFELEVSFSAAPTP